MEAVETAGSSPATSTRGVTSPARSGSRRRHLWSRKSKSEPEKDLAARRAAAVGTHHHRDNLGYAQEPTSTGTGSPVMSLRVRNAAVQCILLVDSVCREVDVLSGVTSTIGRPLTSAKSSSPLITGCANMTVTSSMPSQWHGADEAPVLVTSSSTPLPRLVHQTTATGMGDDLNAYRTAIQYQRRKAIALANGDEETLLTQNKSNCLGLVNFGI